MPPFITKPKKIIIACSCAGLLLICSCICAVSAFFIFNNKSLWAQFQPCAMPTESKTNEEQLDGVAFYYYCHELGRKGEFELVAGDDTNILPNVSYDNTNLNYGKLTLYNLDTNVTEDVLEIGRRTLLQVVLDKQLQGRYHFFMLNTLTGKFCPLPKSDENYEFLCGNLETDFSKFGGIWVYDLEAKKLTRLVAY